MRRAPVPFWARIVLPSAGTLRPPHPAASGLTCGTVECGSPGGQLKKKRGRPFGSAATAAAAAAKAAAKAAAVAVMASEATEAAAGPVLSPEELRRQQLMAADEAWARDRRTTTRW